MSASSIPFRRAHRTFWLCAAPAGTVALTLAHPSATRMQTWPWAALAAALWLLPLAGLIITLAAAERWRSPGPIVSWALVALAVGAVVSGGISPFGTLSLAQVWPVLGTVAFCFLLHHGICAAGVREEALATIVAAAGGIIGGASLVVWLTAGWPTPWVERNTFPFGHSTYLAGFLVLALPWLAERIWSAHGPRRLALGGLTLTSIAALFSTSSRAGVIVVALVAIVTAAAVLFGSARPRHQKIILAALALAVAGTGLATNPRLRELITQRAWGDTARASNLERSAMLDAGMRLGRARPWLGWGPGSVPLAYPTVRAALAGGDENVLQLHNTPAQLFATLGAIGVASGLALLAGLALAVTCALRRGRLSPVQIAAAASLAAGFVFSLTDHALDLPIVAALAGVGVAVASGPGREHILNRRQRALLVLGLIAIAAAPALSLRRDLLARRAYDRALDAMATDDGAAVLRALDTATAFVPNDAFFQHQAAHWLLQQRTGPSAASRQSDLADAAIARLEAALRTGVHLEFAHFNLGWLLLERAQPQQAAAHFIAAARLVPDKGGVYFGLGLACQALGRHADAIRAFALEWLNDPRQFTSPSWEVPALASLAPAVRIELLHLLERVSGATPAAAATANWIRWWHGENAGNPAPAAAFSRESAAFAEWLTRGSSAPRAPAPAYPWGALHTAWRDGAGFDAPVLAGGDRAFAAALARRAGRHRDDFRAFVAAPIGDEAALAATFRRQRRGAGVLALHPEGPLLTDAYIVQENRIAQLVAPLFPPKGWLPGRFLLALLPPDPR